MNATSPKDNIYKKVAERHESHKWGMSENNNNKKRTTATTTTTKELKINSFLVD